MGAAGTKTGGGGGKVDGRGVDPKTGVPGGGGGPTEAPQPWQKVAPGMIGVPQYGHGGGGTAIGSTNPGTGEFLRVDPYRRTTIIARRPRRPRRPRRAAPVDYADSFSGAVSRYRSTALPTTTNTRPIPTRTDSARVSGTAPPYPERGPLETAPER